MTPPEQTNTASDAWNYRPNVIPFEVEKRLDFIDISEDGTTILGSSNLTGRYWRGSLWYFKDASEAPDKEKSVTGVECNTSICDGKFLDSRKVIVGDDIGGLSVYELNDEDKENVMLEGTSLRHDHDSCVLCVAVSPDKASALTTGIDLCIKVWDLQEFVPNHIFRSAHSQQVTNVAYSAQQSPHVFASCALDGLALLWDTRQPKPATVLVDVAGEGLTSLAWQEGDSNTLLIGSTFGNIMSVDVRGEAITKKAKVHQRSVYRLLSVEPRLLVSCADSIELKVVDPLSDNFAERYKDTRHTHCVRGLAFDKKSLMLYSCGWDKKVLSHKLPL